MESRARSSSRLFAAVNDQLRGNRGAHREPRACAILRAEAASSWRIAASAWQIEVLPPTEAAFDSGARTYRCVAGVTAEQPTTSQFRR